MNIAEIKRRCLELMERSDLVYLSSVDENGYPHIRAMTNLRNREQFSRLRGVFDEHKEDFLVYLTTNGPSSKMMQFSRQSKSCLYYCSFRDVHGFMLGGTVKIVRDTAIRHMLWQEDWRQFYHDGVDGNEYTVLQFLPVFAKGWYNNHGKFEFAP